jgi:hypothetical protein
MVSAAYGEGEHAQSRAFEKDAPLHGVHRFLRIDTGRERAG